MQTEKAPSIFQPSAFPFFDIIIVSRPNSNVKLFLVTIFAKKSQHMHKSHSVSNFNLSIPTLQAYLSPQNLLAEPQLPSVIAST